jgi:hypothetical protein
MFDVGASSLVSTILDGQVTIDAPAKFQAFQSHGTKIMISSQKFIFPIVKITMIIMPGIKAPMVTPVG